MSRVPVIATRAGGVIDMIKHNINGFLCELDNSHKMAELVEHYLKNREQYVYILENAYSYAFATFSHQKLVENVDSLYQFLFKKMSNLTD
ncbi:glycosyltransferase [candidate division KSB1 bacterium]|nr:glycosyltransferase [candidate division KSB1 bacterium]